MKEKFVCKTPEDTFEVGVKVGGELSAGDVVLLRGGLGAGKTVLTKGILSAFGYDPDEVTSPSFALVGHYRTDRFDVYHIDLWRIDEGGDAAFEVGLDEILENGSNVVIVEWAERLDKDRIAARLIDIHIEGEGDDFRTITVR